MRQLWDKITILVKDVDYMDNDTLIGILNPLRTEEKALEMINFIEENKNNKDVMRIDTLLRKALQIGYNLY